MRKHRKSAFGLVGGIALSLLGAVAAAAQPRTVASIKPIHSLVAAVRRLAEIAPSFHAVTGVYFGY